MFAPLSQNVDGEYDYSTGTAVFLAEVLKATISACMLLYEYVVRSRRTEPAPAGEPLLIAADPGRHILLYFIPALLWFSNNNLAVYAAMPSPGPAHR